MRRKRVRGLALILVGVCAQAAWAYDPADRYETRQIEGWTVRVNKRLAEADAALAERTLAHLRHHLYAIVHRLPEPAVARLREVPIWVELEDKLHPGMCYHPDRKWLVEHDYHPEKARCVELANARNFLTWSIDQPWMVLHELAHAYHDRVLGFEQPEIRAAFERAAASKDYETTLHASGQTRRAYALTDHKEFFAELSEAYFGTNDFFPFVRGELRRHDPESFALLGRLWQDGGERAGAKGDRRAQPPAAGPERKESPSSR